jgi:hypothetical protein
MPPADDIVNSFAKRSREVLWDLTEIAKPVVVR